MSELESLGLETPKLNEINDSYEVENLVENLKQMLYQEYKSTDIFTDWQNICYPVQRLSPYVERICLLSRVFHLFLIHQFS